MTSTCHFYIPPLQLILVFLSTYYIYVIAFCVYIISDLLTSSLYVLFLNVLFIMFMWCFLSTVFTPVAKVPLEYQLTNEEVENYIRSDEQNRNVLLKNIVAKRNLVLHIRTAFGTIRYCAICKVIKPDRAHHCSACGVCVLRMDHHCGWINNCVGFSNEKNFILMLFYCNVYCLYFAGTTVEYFFLYMDTHDERYLPVVVGFFIILFTELVAVIFGLFNCGLLFTNKTTLEKMQHLYFTQENASFNVGCCKNFKEIFGEDWRVWLFPVFSAVGNGAAFPIVVKN